MNDKAPSPVTAESLVGVPLLDLMARARLAAAGAGVRPFTCAIVNLKSGGCGEDCAFCAQSARYRTGAAEYPWLDEKTLLAKAEAAARHGCRYLGLVTSGDRLDEADFQRLLSAAEAVKSRFELELCASVGRVEARRAAELKAAGFTSCHHNLEAGPSFFRRICTTHRLEDRLETLAAVRSAGLRLCSGGLFGLGENWGQRLELARLLNDQEVDSIPVNFLMPTPGTPLGGRPVLAAAEALRIIALLRLVNPGRDLVICGGREAALGSLKNMCFCAGANGLMIGDYLTAKGCDLNQDLAELAALELF